ncbi:hypothetical protein AWB94_04260 [Mycolicibacterium canariasense]|nr:hypothetical protein AWB94_04260 [Mycolicibacterium canariasense]
MQTFVKPAIVLALAATAAACSSHPQAGPASAHSSAPPSGSTAIQQLGSPAQGQVPAWAVIHFLGRHGLPTDHPLDVTDQACQDRQCQQSVITDTVQVTSFATAAAAQSYARRHSARATANIVVTFSPVLSTIEREQLWSAVTEAVQ